MSEDVTFVWLQNPSAISFIETYNPYLYQLTDEKTS